MFAHHGAAGLTRVWERTQPGDLAPDGEGDMPYDTTLSSAVNLGLGQGVCQGLLLFRDWPGSSYLVASAAFCITCFSFVLSSFSLLLIKLSLFQPKSFLMYALLIFSLLLPSMEV